MKHCRYLRRKLLQFLDDGMGGHSSFVIAVRQRNELFSLLCKLGFRLSTKSSPLPEQTKQFLGMIVHMAGTVPTFHVPQDKIEKLKGLLTETLSHLDAWTMRKLAKITGKCLSMSLDIPMTRLMSRSVYACMHSNSEKDWDALVRHDEQAIKELKWMMNTIDLFNVWMVFLYGLLMI